MVWCKYIFLSLHLYLTLSKYRPLCLVIIHAFPKDSQSFHEIINISLQKQTPAYTVGIANTTLALVWDVIYKMLCISCRIQYKKPQYMESPLCCLETSCKHHCNLHKTFSSPFCSTYGKYLFFHLLTYGVFKSNYIILSPNHTFKKGRWRCSYHLSVSQTWPVFILPFKLVQLERVSGHYVSYCIFSCSSSKLLSKVSNAADGVVWRARLKWSDMRTKCNSYVQFLMLKSSYVND